MIIDIFSRRVVGWRVADAESATLFRPLFDDAIEKHNVRPGQFTLHADRGAPMKAKATALLLADLGVTRFLHNRPHTSNDNPFSESHFKTLKWFQPRFPKRFGCIETPEASAVSSSISTTRTITMPGSRLMTPDQVHYGQIDAVHAARQISRSIRRSANIRSASSTKPQHHPTKPTATWINPPTPKVVAECWPMVSSRVTARPACLPPSWHRIRDDGVSAAFRFKGCPHCVPLRNATRTHAR